MATEDIAIREEIKRLYNRLRRVARLASKRKLSDEERSIFQEYLMIIASMLSKAKYGLRVYERWIDKLEVYVLAAEEGKGKKLELPKHIGDIKIDRSKEIKILQQAGLMEEPSVFMRYWREIITGLIVGIVLLIIAYFLKP